jgi:hypothetical protein
VANYGHRSEENQFRTNHHRTRQSRCEETPGCKEEKKPARNKLNALLDPLNSQSDGWEEQPAEKAQS